MTGIQTGRIAGMAACLLAAVVAGCASTQRGIVVMEDERPKPVTPEEVTEMSGGEEPQEYLLQVGDQVAVGFEIKDYRPDDVPWDYRIEVGDRMEVRLTAELGDRPLYRIDVGDLIGISFLNNWQLNSNKTVRPDGYITMPELGDVKAAGLTPIQLQEKLTTLFGKTGIIAGDPHITVNVDFSNVDRLENSSRDVVVRPDGAIRIPQVKADILVAGLTVAEAGAAIRTEAAKVFRNPPEVTLVVFPFINTVLQNMGGTFSVRPDGMISIPRLGEVPAAGFGVTKLREDIDAMASKIAFNDINSAVDVVTVTGSRIYIGGEVGVPGVYPLAATPTALQALMMARGLNNDSRLNTVIVVRRNPEGKPHVFKLDLKAALIYGRTENDIPLRAFDIVYVPKKPVSRVNLFVEQYIEEIVPFDNNLGVQGTYYLNEQDVDTESYNKNVSLGAATNVTRP
jgi:polysaccharide biosynthesis/export protein PslD